MPAEVKLTLNGQEVTLAYDWDAQIKAEKDTGVNLITPLEANSEFIRAMLYARLLKHHPQVTLQEVSSLIPHNVNLIATTLNKIGETVETESDTTEEPAKATEDGPTS